MTNKQKKTQQPNPNTLIILRDEERINKLKKASRTTSLIGMLILFSGLVVSFIKGAEKFALYYPFISLSVGFFIAQIGLYLTHRYLRDPRPDQVLDKALKKEIQNGRLYHFYLPASHVLLTHAGPILFLLKYQRGKISVDGDKWQQKGIGFRRFFGQEGLGNPTHEAENMLKRFIRYIEKNAPSLANKEIPMGILIVFTHVDKQELNLQKSSIPAVHHTQVSNFLRKYASEKLLSDEDYETLRLTFDKTAKLISEEVK